MDSGGWSCVQRRSLNKRPGEQLLPEAKALCRHHLQIFTAEKQSKFENFCKIGPLVLDQPVSGLGAK